MIIREADLERVVQKFVQPLNRGIFVSKTGIKARIDNVSFNDNRADYLDTSPFGFSSNPTPDVFAYFLNLGGSQLFPIIIGHQHNLRPLPSNQGGSIQYSTNASGSSVVALVECFPDGKIVLVPNDRILLGSVSSAEPLILGNAFKTLFNAHMHIGNLGAPSGSPIVPMDSTQLSTKAFTEI